MWHTVFIALHAAAGLVALSAGVVALRRGRLFGLYLWSLAGMLGFLVLAVAVQWQRNDPGLRLLFSAFIVLGGVMVWRARLAGRDRPGAAGPSGSYLNHVGFTLVALFDAFMVITVLNAGAPVWAVVACGVAVAVAGHYALRAAHLRLVRSAEAPARAPAAAGGSRAG